jgi:hypothetical protein
MYLRTHGSTRSYAFSMIELPLEKIPVVCEYIGVFFRMSCPECHQTDIELSIELQPGITPISKRPYRMPLAELGKLKKHL